MAVDRLQAELARVLAEMGVADAPAVALERPRNPEHGDWSTNLALTLAKPLGRPPRQIAEELARRIDAVAAGVSAVEVAGPGFINFRLASDYLGAGLTSILAAGHEFGRSDAGAGRAVNVEFVSANPTGPLHIGHGRQAALGDAVSELLAWAGWKVHREFYYNDAGEQIMRLARSVWARYQQEAGAETPFPEDGYHGEYVRELARELVAEHGARWKNDGSATAMDEMRRFAVARLRAEQNRDLDGFRVKFDEFFLESSLYSGG